MSKEQLYVIVKPDQPVENAKKFMYIAGCDQCMHKQVGQEKGGSFPAGAAVEEKDVWYYCFHPDFSGWPKRIGQKAETKVIPEFCPLLSLISEDEFSAAKKNKKNKMDQILNQSDAQKGA